MPFYDEEDQIQEESVKNDNAGTPFEEEVESSGEDSSSLHNEVRIAVPITEEQDIVIHCPDCRGQFDVEKGDIVEEEVIECPLCAAELEVVSESPIKLRMFDEESQFA